MNFIPYSLVLISLLLSACSTFSSQPAQFDAHFGESVRAMQIAQTYNPATRQQPSDRVILTHDGKKQLEQLNSTYRGDVWHLKLQRNDTDVNKFFPGMGDRD